MARRAISVIIAIITAVSIAGGYFAASGSIVDAGTLGGESQAYAVNGSGQIVGLAATANGVVHAFRSNGRQVADLGTLGGMSGAEGIDDTGRVVGTARTPSGAYRAFLWTDGTMADLGTLGGNTSYAHGIGASGLIVGLATTDTEESHAYLWANGVMADLNTSASRGAGWILQEAWAVGDAGQVVGLGRHNGQSHAFLDLNEKITDLGTLGGTMSVARSVNHSGQVVGWAQASDGTHRAFLWSDGKMFDLGTLGGRESEATGINDTGQIVGWAQTANGTVHAVLWRDGAAIDLNDTLPIGAGWVLERAQAISTSGQIVGFGQHGGRRAFVIASLPR